MVISEVSMHEAAEKKCFLPNGFNFENVDLHHYMPCHAVGQFCI